MKLFSRFLTRLQIYVAVFLFFPLSGIHAAPTQNLELVVQNGPYGVVHKSDFSPDGKLLATVSGDSKLRIWDVESGRLIREMGSEPSPMTAVAFSPNGKHVATGKSLGDMGACRGACDFRIEIWDIGSGKPVRTIKRKKKGRVWDIVYSPDGKFLVSSSLGLEIRLVSTGKIIKTIYERKGFNSMEFSNKGKYLAAGGYKKIGLWRTDNWTQVHLLKAHKKNVSSIGFYLNDKYLISASDDNTVKIWNNALGELLQSHKVPGEYQYLTWILATHDNKRSITVGTNAKIRITDLESGRTKKLFTRAGTPPNFYALFYRENGIDYQTTHKGNIVASGFLPLKMPPNENQINLPAQGSPNHLALHPTKPWFAVTYRGGYVNLWNYETGQFLKEIGSESNMISTLDFSKDGKRLVMGGSDDSIKVWSPTENTYSTLGDKGKSVRSLAFSSDGKWLAAGGFKRQLRFWRVEKNGELSVFGKPAASGHGAEQMMGLQVGVSRSIEKIAFHPHKNLLAVGGHGMSIILWNAETAEPVGELKDPSLDDYTYTLAFSPDGHTLASGSGDHKIRIWDLKTMKLQKTFEGYRTSPSSLAYHPHKSLLYSGGEDRNIRVWDLEKGTMIKTLVGHQGGVNQLIFNKKGTRLYSGAGDGTICIWNEQSVNPIKTLKGKSLGLFTIALSPDESIIAGASNNVILWDVKSGKELATLWSFGKDQWIVTSGNQFDASAEGTQRLHFVKGLQFVPLKAQESKSYQGSLLSRVFSKGLFGR